MVTKHHFKRIKDHACSSQEFSIVRANEHGLLRTVPVPEDLSAYYQDDYISHINKPTSIMELVYAAVRKFMMLRKKKWLRRWHPMAQSLLDVGSGNGTFIQAAKHWGYTVSGTEPNKRARSSSREKGLEVVPGHADLEGNTYDIITLWHVLEHMRDPAVEIEALAELLDPDGVFVIALPNYLSLDARIYQKVWAAYDVPRHLWHFSPSAITELMRDKGFELLGRKPLWFDAIYVAMLSEKFLGSKGSVIKGFINGLWSNWAARSTSQYSSVTYAFKRAK